jgi:hypothetical protein
VSDEDLRVVDAIGLGPNVDVVELYFGPPLCEDRFFGPNVVAIAVCPNLDYYSNRIKD